MFNEYEYFDLKPEHIKLLTSAYISWDSCEFGAPAIDPKRPYGNSWVYGDIAEIFDMKPHDEYDEFSEEQKEFMDDLHKETKTALQIILATQSFIPGMYRCPKYSIKWERIEDDDAE